MDNLFCREKYLTDVVSAKTEKTTSTISAMDPITNTRILLWRGKLHLVVYDTDHWSSQLVFLSRVYFNLLVK